MSDYKKQYVTAMVFEAVAQLLPTMGRDFVVKIHDITDNSINMEVVGLTPIGIAVQNEINAKIRDKLAEMMVERGGSTND